MRFVYRNMIPGGNCKKEQFFKLRLFSDQAFTFVLKSALKNRRETVLSVAFTTECALSCVVRLHCVIIFSVAFL